MSISGLWPRMSAIARSSPRSVACWTMCVAAVCRSPWEVSRGSSILSTMPASERSYERGRTSLPVRVVMMRSSSCHSAPAQVARLPARPDDGRRSASCQRRSGSSGASARSSHCSTTHRLSCRPRSRRCGASRHRCRGRPTGARALRFVAVRRAHRSGTRPPSDDPRSQRGSDRRHRRPKRPPPSASSPSRSFAASRLGRRGFEESALRRPLPTMRPAGRCDRSGCFARPSLPAGRQAPRSSGDVLTVEHRELDRAQARSRCAGSPTRTAAVP